MDEPVIFSLAFRWECPNCARENFTKHEHDGIPSSVICQECQRVFPCMSWRNAVPLPSDSNDNEPQVS